jgi:flagellar basal-body rod protein FlgB
MDLHGLRLFQRAMTKMDWAAQRQKVLSQNVVNSDTPDYKSRDLKPLDFKHMLRDEIQPVKVARTNANHIKGTIPEQDPFRARTLMKSF